MGAGDFRAPFFVMAFCYLISTLLFWALFRPYERAAARQGTVPAVQT